MGTPEQRAHPRVPLVLQVQYPDKEGFLADATENLSATGAFVRTDQVLQVGDQIPVVISFPGLLDPLELTGVVAWVRPQGPDSPAGVGLKIPEDRPEDRSKLAKIVSRIRGENVPGDERRGYRILLVEDNPHIMEMYEYVMRKLSRGRVAIEVALAQDGHDALAKVRGERFDLIVTDLFMPVLDGFEFIRRLRREEASATVPVVAISAGGSDTAALAREAGANVYLRKPVRFVDVVDTVRGLLKL
jgi:uncharacterized protein (TIGR02266 family)